MATTTPTHRVTFEVVSPFAAGGVFYRGDKPACRPEDVPDEFWTTTFREADEDSIRGQAAVLASWAQTGEQLIRNVRMFKVDRTETEVEI